MTTRAHSAGGGRGYRLKPAPRARGRGAGRIQWDRVGRVALVLVLFAVLVSYVSPALNFFDAWRDSKTEHASLTELRSENAQLRERITALDGKDAAEREARQLGMIGEYEGAYVVRGLTQDN